MKEYFTHMTELDHQKISSIVYHILPHYFYFFQDLQLFEEKNNENERKVHQILECEPIWHPLLYPNSPQLDVLRSLHDLSLLSRNHG